jgi:ribonuclease P protein component
MRTAVERNLIRRRLTAAVESQLTRLAGVDLVVSTGEGALRLRYADLCSELAAGVEAVLHRLESSAGAAT